jgi:excisionase family DNA binding protein
MNKKEAAEYLGITPRALEYHVKQRNIGARKEKGKTGDIAVFDESEVRKLKATIDARRAPVSAVERIGHESHEAEPRSIMRLSDASLNQSPQTALQVQDLAPLGARLIEALEGLQSRGAAQSQAHDGVRVSEKFTLSLIEAAQLSGLSRGHLRTAIEEKKLKARIIGRGWRVKRDDLEAYIRKL